MYFWKIKQQKKLASMFRILKIYLLTYIMTQPNLQYAAHNKIQYSSNNHITSDKEMQKIEENLAVL